MENYIPITLVTAAVFLVMILQLAAKPKFAAKITGACIVAAAIGGVLLYGYGFACTISNPLLAITRALLAVCGMFVGKIDSAVLSAPLLQNLWMMFLFYLVHLFALYATASAAITTVGAEALQKLRLWLARRGELSVIFGVDDRSLDFGKALLAEQKCSVLFVGKSVDPAMTNTIIKAGCAVRSDDHALKATPKFLKAIGIRGSRKVTLYALNRDTAENLPYAKAFLSSLEACGIEPHRTTLVIPGKEDSAVSRLQVLGDRYGYGYVNCFRETGLAARLLTQQYPPCDTMEFDEAGLATSDFHALVVGFGQMGQTVLRQLVMNGQFVGSRFRADIFAPDCMTTNGHFADSYPALTEQYDIRFHADDAFSTAFFRFIREEARGLKYIVLCTGSEKSNREIAENLTITLGRMGLELPIYLCSYQGVSCCQADGSFTKPYELYQPRTLSAAKLDRMAMVLNHSYHGATDKSPEELWMGCDYFSRMSCRASTDFVPAIVRAAGKTMDEARSGDWSLSQVQLDHLGQLEHLRWNAFHFAMGYETMTAAEFDDRAAQWQKQKETMEKPTVRIAKNALGRTHACLVGWDELDALSAKEKAITGKDVDYKHEDVKNILAIPALLQAAENI